MKEYAGLLYMGEEKRDASDKIAGFLYQDLLAIDLILNANDEDRAYVEWIEDIMVENADSISIYQVKYYPKSNLYSEVVYKGLLYQFLKFKLVETDKEQKKFKTYCLYHADKYIDNNKTNKNYIYKENNLKEIDRKSIISQLKSYNMEEREALIFKEVASTELLDEFQFERHKKKSIKEERKNIEEQLYIYFKDSISRCMIKFFGDEQVKEILASIAIQYIQKSYYEKTKDYQKRYFDKRSFEQYIIEKLQQNEEKVATNIKYIVASHIDSVFNDVINEINNIEILEIYRKLYFSTKRFFEDALKEKEQRFKFLNTISTQNYEELNKKIYMGDTKTEVEWFREYSHNIREFIRRIWKILFNIDTIYFDQFIKEGKDCFLFEFPNEKIKPVLILSPHEGSIREATKTFTRVRKMSFRPKKWYFKEGYSGLHRYSQDISKIREAKVDQGFNILLKDSKTEYFRIECMQCIKIDEEEMGIKDKRLDSCLFDINCTVKGD